MDWLYRFTSNPSYPNPVEEIDALCTLDDDGEQAFLLLADRSAPPLSGAPCEDIVGLCTSDKGRLILHGTGAIGGVCIRGNTPQSVQPLYGCLTGRAFSPLVDLMRLPSKALDEAVLSKKDQESFLNGQSFVKRLRASKRTSGRSANRGKAKTSRSEPEHIASTFAFPRTKLPKSDFAFKVVGLDPTAGTWDSQMTEGTKEMPSFALQWTGLEFRPQEKPLDWHKTNEGFWKVIKTACLTCIDGPCGTNGPILRKDRKNWDPSGGSGTRAGELALSRAGVNLFWTTQNTVMKFDGASRWIARSLVLFSQQPDQEKIETHPHGAFTFLWRMFGNSGAPPKKSTNRGRQARLAILGAFIPQLREGMVPNHDAVDAACAALVAGLHRLRLTKPFGTAKEGGVIWMPDTEELARILHA